MTKYRVTMETDDNGLKRLIHSGAIQGATIVPIGAEQDDADVVHQLHPAAPTRLPHKTRAPRGSKVNDALINALADGPRDTKALKEALVKANLAAGSLSTGVAQLMKSGQIERSADGMYSLPTRKAAE
jgi:hypothetical protein